MKKEIVKKDLVSKLINIFNGCESYYNLYDLFNNLVDYDENDFQSEAEENAYYEYLNEGDFFSKIKENKKEWLEQYRKEKQNED